MRGITSVVTEEEKLAPEKKRVSSMVTGRKKTGASWPEELN